MPSDAQGRDENGLSVLIVDDEANIRKTLALSLELDGHSVIAVGNARDGLIQASLRAFDLLFLDLRLGTEKGLDHIAEFISGSPWIRIVIITAYASVETAIEAMKRGAADYLSKPFTPDQVRAVTRRVAETRRAMAEAARLSEGEGREPPTDLDSRAPAMQRALELARQAAPTDAAILLRGESGTGKGILARLIHAWSGRRARPFAVVSCPSLSPELLESELFGHVRGAFTGALRDSAGRIAATDGGTLFLDEVGDLPPQVQPKLLRFLQDRQYERVGEGVTRKADLRVLAATNLDLQALVREGRFREDLLFRLNVLTVELPPLRERPDDLRSLAQRFLSHFSRVNRRQFLGFTEEAWAALGAYSWPGNLRELRNVVERASILARGEWIAPPDLGLTPSAESGRVRLGDAATLERIEEEHIRLILASTKSLEEASRILGIDAVTLWRKRKKFRL
jgi:NtrC-family two-component system response regulator AlgB